jgi:RimJ/RimL family protein N-acetyltransferase
VPLLTGPVLPAGSMAARSQPGIAGDGVRLRPWLPDDLAAVLAGYADPDIRRWHCRSMDADEARDWIAGWAGRWRAETGAGWAVTEDGAVTGQISLRRVHLADGLAEVSYWVLPAGRGRGTAARALVALARWGLGELGLHRIELHHSTANPASCRVALRAGFAAEGTKRSEALHADGWHDMHLHAKIDGLAP